MADPWGIFDEQGGIIKGEQKQADPWGVFTPEELSAPVASEPPSILGEIPRGLKAGVQQLRGFGYGLGALVGATDWAKEGLADVEAKTPKPAVASFADIGKKGDYLSDTAKYLAYGVAANLPNMALSMTGGGLGVLAGKTLAKGAVAKAGTELLGKEILKKAATRGMMTGAGAASLGMEAGSIAGDQLTETGKVDPLRAMAGAIPAAILDVVPEWYLFKRMGWLGGEELKRTTGRLLHGAKEFGRQSLVEAPTEAMQSVIERASVPGKSITNAEAWDEYINSFILGGMTGGVVGGIIGTTAKKTINDSQETPVQKILKNEGLANQIEADIAELDTDGVLKVEVPPVLEPATEAPIEGQPGVPPTPTTEPPPSGAIPPTAPITPEAPQEPPSVATVEGFSKTGYTSQANASQAITLYGGDRANLDIVEQGGKWFVTPKAEEKVASVKMMLTQADKAALRGLGYTDDAIANMTPDEGAAIIAQGTVAEQDETLSEVKGETAEGGIVQPGKEIKVYRGEGAVKFGDSFTTDPGDLGRGVYHTTSADEAKAYGEGGKITESTIKFDNPLVLTEKEAYELADKYGTLRGTREQRIAAAQKMTDDLISKGHDGLISIGKDSVGAGQRMEVVDYRSLRKIVRPGVDLEADYAKQAADLGKITVFPGIPISRQDEYIQEAKDRGYPDAEYVADSKREGRIVATPLAPTPETAAPEPTLEGKQDEQTGQGTEGQFTPDKPPEAERQARLFSLSLDQVEKSYKQGYFGMPEVEEYLAHWNANPGRLTEAYWEDGAIRQRKRKAAPPQAAEEQGKAVSTETSAERADRVFKETEAKFAPEAADTESISEREARRKAEKAVEVGKQPWEINTDRLGVVERILAGKPPKREIPLFEKERQNILQDLYAEGKLPEGYVADEFGNVSKLPAPLPDKPVISGEAKSGESLPPSPPLSRQDRVKTGKAKVIPVSKAAEDTVTTPKEQKAYVLDKLDGLIADARARFREQNDTKDSNYTDADLDEAISKGRFASEAPPAGAETVTIEVPNDGQFKIPNTLRGLLTFQKNMKKMSTSTTSSRGMMPPILPSNKPTGKTAAEFEKEAQAEADAITKDREDVRDNYLYIKDKAIPAADADYTKWSAIQEDLMNQKRTLKSIAAEFYGTAKSFGKSPSGQDVRDRVRRARDNISTQDRILRDAEINIRNNYPSLAAEMFPEAKGEVKLSTPTKGVTVNESGWADAPTEDAEVGLLRKELGETMPGKTIANGGIAQVILQEVPGETSGRGTQETLRHPVHDATAQNKQAATARGVEKIAGIWGKQVIWVRITDPNIKFNGVVSSLDPNKIFINIDAINPHLKVLGHELLHTLKMDNQALYDQLLAYLEADITNLKDYGERLTGGRQESGFKGEFTEADIKEDLLADLAGDHFMEPDFWNAMSKQNPTLFEKVIQIARDIISKALNTIGIRTDTIAMPYFKDINKSRKVLAEAMSKYAKEKGTGVKSIPAKSGIKTMVSDSQDTAYLKAVESGDMESAQKMVDEAAKRAGYTSPRLFRGSVEDDGVILPESFETGGGIFLTDSEDVAAIFTYPREYGEVVTETYDEEADEYVENEPGPVIQAYVKLENPLVLTRDTEIDSQDFVLDTALQVKTIKAAKAAGHDGIVVQDTKEGVGDWMEEGTTYVVFDPSQVKSAEPVTRDKDNVIPLSQRFDEKTPDIRFSTSLNPPSTNQRASWDSPEPSKMSNFVYTFLDKHVDLRNVVKAIKKVAGDIADTINPDVKQRLYASIVAEKYKQFLEREFSPLAQDMAKSNVTLDGFQEYLWYRTARETNKHIASLVDKKGNPVGLQDGGSGKTEAQIKAYEKALDPQKKAVYDRLAVRTDKMLAINRDLIVAYQLESQSTVDKWAATYKKYAPLFRADIESGIGTGEGFSVTGPVSRKRKGSTREVVDILAHIAEQREIIITRGEKNKIAIALNSLAEMFPNPDFWKTIKINRLSTYIAEGISAKVNDNVVAARILDPKTGEIKQIGVEFNTRNKQAERMASALKNIDMDTLGPILGNSAKVTRFIASMNTQYNPVFGIVNFVRDVQTAIFNLSSTEIAGKQKQVMALTIPALKAIYTDLRSKKGGAASTDPMVMLWEDFRAHGGPTGYRDLFRTSADRTNAIANELHLLQQGGGVKKTAIKGLIVVRDWLSDYNTAMENSVRLSAYKVAIDSGMSKEKAAVLAKSLTVDFNRKGQIATQAGALYAFFNASAQGTARIYETLTGPAGKRIIYGGITLGVLQAAMMAAAGFDDDDPPEFVRERNLIIPTFTGKEGKGYITIPMPLGLHVLPNIGRITSEWAMGGFKSPIKKFSDLLGVMVESFNPMGASGLSLQTITPTAIDPLAALSANKDWTGKQIYRENFSSLAPTPGFTRTKDTATWFSKQLAWAINRLSGGTEYKPGLYSPTADEIDYLQGQLTGGVGRELNKSIQAAQSVGTGEELPTYKIPLISRFYGSTEGQSNTATSFYHNLKALNQHEMEIKGRIKNKESITEYIKDNPEARLWRMANKAESSIARLTKRKRELKERDASKESIKTIDALITNHMKRFNQTIKQAEG